MNAPQPAAGEAVPEDVDVILSAHDGDARAAIEALLSELRLTRAAVSFGFSRGWHHRGEGPVQR